MSNRAHAICLALILSPFAAACQRTAAAPARRGGPGGPGGGVPVVVTSATQKDVPVDLQAIGNVEAYETISVRSQVTGQLTEVRFHEGDFVKKGETLFLIDPRPFEAALQQAQANLVRDGALLDQAEAQLNRDAANAEYLQLTAERQAQLNQRGIVAKDAVDQARAAADANAALVKADKASVASAKAQLDAQQAAVDTTKVQLSYTTIRSPIDGRTGNLAVKEGNLVAANTTELMTIAQVQPVYVTFSVPATHLPTIKRQMTGQKLAVVATPQDAEPQPASGLLTFIDNSVDPTTDTIRLKATFSNPDRRLWPGQFARVTLRLMTLPHAVVVPMQAVQTGQNGEYVFVVKADSTVEQRPIVTGDRLDQDIVVQKGLGAGETVVTEGQLRLEPGSKITTRDPNQAPAPSQNGPRRRPNGGGGRRGA